MSLGLRLGCAFTVLAFLGNRGVLLAEKHRHRHKLKPQPEAPTDQDRQQNSPDCQIGLSHRPTQIPPTIIAFPPKLLHLAHRATSFPDVGESGFWDAK